MNTSKVTFKNKNGEKLSGYLELPTNQKPHNFVLFAHCFTCNKNYFAPKNISRELASSGFGVLRFDFTGLGESRGDFSDTNFSGNIEDLIAAAGFLEEKYTSPSLLVGHSLGGAAVLFAAEQLSSVKAIATIAAPSTIRHVEALLSENIDEIEKGHATVKIGGRPFTIKKQFLEDLQKHDLESYLSDIKRALLILHSPIDDVVGIKNAEDLYIAAKHPKSFVSLDGASHLLEEEKDSKYAGKVIASWAGKYIHSPKEEEKPESDHEVVANLGEEGFTTQIKAGDHYLTADEPEKMGGANLGPTPYELLSAGLAACTSMTIQMYAERKKWKIDNVETHVNYTKKHAVDCQNCENDTAKIDTFEREIVVIGDLDKKQRERLLEIANKCPVHRTLSSQSQVISRLKE